MNKLLLNIKQLRKLTSASIMECKKAVIQANGDIKKSLAFLQSKGLESHRKISDSTSSSVFLRKVDDSFFLFKIQCETPFALKNAYMQKMVTNVAKCLNRTTCKIYHNKITQDHPSFNDIKNILKEGVFILKENIFLSDIYVFKSKYIGYYEHHNSNCISMVEIFPQNKSLTPATLSTVLSDLSIQVAAFSPLFLDISTIGELYKIKQKKIFRTNHASNQGSNSKNSIFKNYLDKKSQESTLLRQQFIKNMRVNISMVIKKYEISLATKIRVKNFIILKSE